MNIPVNSPKGIKLLTKGKYVTDDIEVTPVLQDKSVTPTDTVQSVSADDGYAGLDTVKISAVEIESGAATPSAAAQTVTPSEGKFFDKFTVNATPTETKTIDANGTFTPSVGKFFSEVTVNVDTAKPEQTKAVDIDSMDPVTVTPDAGHVLTEVTVTPKAPLAATGDATAAAGDILAGKTAYANGAKVTGTIELADAAATPALEAQELTPPAGTYYKKVTVAATPLDDVKTVTAGTTPQTVNPAAGNLGIKAVTVNPTPSSAKTITPTKDTQTVNPDSDKLLSSVTVNPIPEAYIIPAGTKNITENGTVDVTSFAKVNVAVPAPDLSDATATPAKILLGATAYTGAGKITGTIPTYDGSLRQKSLEESTWAEIAQVSANKSWDAMGWKVGDTKTITLNGTVGTVALNNYQCKVYILGFDHNAEKEGQGISFGMLEGLDGKQFCLVDGSYTTNTSSATAFTMNTSDTNSGGWKNCHMRKTILGSTDVANGDATSAAITNPASGTLMAILPSDLRAVLKPITKYTNNVGYSSEASAITPTVDYLPLLSEYEVFKTHRYANSNEDAYQAQYQYYANGKSKVKYQHNNTSKTVYWWLRSPTARFSRYFCVVSADGTIDYIYSNESYGVAPVFLV